MVKNSFRPILNELLWLLIAFIVASVICYLVFDWDARGAIVSLQKHDTYFVLSTAMVIPPVFLFMTFVLYFIKESRNRFSKKLPNIILLITGLLLITLLVFVNRELGKFETNYGWTAYPPLSMLPQSPPQGAQTNPFSIVVNVLTVLQILVTIALLYAVFHWGRNSQSSLMQ